MSSKNNKQMSNATGGASGSNSSRNEIKPQNASRQINQAKATSTSKSSSSSVNKETNLHSSATGRSNNSSHNNATYLNELTEDKINEEKSQIRYEQMMKKFKNLTKESDYNDEELDNIATSRSQSHKHASNAGQKNFYHKNEDDDDDEDDRASVRSKSKASNKTVYVDNSESDYVKNTIRAPNELKEEFLVYIMNKQWEDAFKLCKFILMYEPENEIARQYLPMIEFKLEQSSESEEDDDDDDDDNDEESNDEDGEDEDDDSDDSDDSDDESDEDDDDEKKQPPDPERQRQMEDEVQKLKEMYRQMKPKEDPRYKETRITRSGASSASSTSSSRNNAAAASSHSHNTTKYTQNSTKKPR